MTAALAMNPDAIYILGDGAFHGRHDADCFTCAARPADSRFTRSAWRSSREAKPNCGRLRRPIRATYRAVRASPLAREMALQNPIPRNRTRGSVWGQTLPGQGRT